MGVFAILRQFWFTWWLLATESAVNDIVCVIVCLALLCWCKVAMFIPKAVSLVLLWILTSNLFFKFWFTWWLGNWVSCEWYSVCVCHCLSRFVVLMQSCRIHPKTNFTSSVINIKFKLIFSYLLLTSQFDFHYFSCCVCCYTFQEMIYTHYLCMPVLALFSFVLLS